MALYAILFMFQDTVFLIAYLKKEFSHIKLICAVPYAGFENNWKKEWRERYCRILISANEVHYISDRYTRGVYQKRNEWMIDHA